MSDRTPAGDKGTADRIEADDGGYWVRLVTKQALKREGECMVNCLRHGSYNGLAGEEDMLPESMDDTLWSLRKRCGTSYALAEVSCYGSAKAWRLGEMKGPHNTTPSRWSVRQVRHLRDAYRTAGADLRLNDEIALVGLDGMTYRPDVAPEELRRLADQRGISLLREMVVRGSVQIGPTTVLARPANSPPGTPFIPMGDLGSFSGLGINPFRERHHAFALTEAEADPVVRVFSIPHSLGERYITRSGIQFDVEPDMLTGSSQEKFLRAYRSAIDRAARIPVFEAGICRIVGSPLRIPGDR